MVFQYFGVTGVYEGNGNIDGTISTATALTEIKAGDRVVGSLVTGAYPTSVSKADASIVSNNGTIYCQDGSVGVYAQANTIIFYFTTQNGTRTVTVNHGLSSDDVSFALNRDGTMAIVTLLTAVSNNFIVYEIDKENQTVETYKSFLSGYSVERAYGSDVAYRKGIILGDFILIPLKDSSNKTSIYKFKYDRNTHTVTHIGTFSTGVTDYKFIMVQYKSDTSVIGCCYPPHALFKMVVDGDDVNITMGSALSNSITSISCDGNYAIYGQSNKTDIYTIDNSLALGLYASIPLEYGYILYGNIIVKGTGIYRITNFSSGAYERLVTDSSLISYTSTYGLFIIPSNLYSWYNGGRNAYTYRVFYGDINSNYQVSKDLSNYTKENQLYGVAIDNMAIGTSGPIKVLWKDERLNGNATSGDILSGKIAYVGGSQIVGDYVPLDTSDATASSLDIAYQKTAYVDGVKVEGSLSVVNEGSTGAYDVSYTEYDDPYTGDVIRKLTSTAQFGDKHIVADRAPIHIEADAGDVASAIGLTSDILVRGNTILGVSGSASTSSIDIPGIEVSAKALTDVSTGSRFKLTPSEDIPEDPEVRLSTKHIDGDLSPSATAFSQDGSSLISITSDGNGVYKHIRDNGSIFTYTFDIEESITIGTTKGLYVGISPNGCYAMIGVPTTNNKTRIYYLIVNTETETVRLSSSSKVVGGSVMNMTAVRLSVVTDKYILLTADSNFYLLSVSISSSSVVIDYGRGLGSGGTNLPLSIYYEGDITYVVHLEFGKVYVLKIYPDDTYGPFYAMKSMATGTSGNSITPYDHTCFISTDGKYLVISASDASSNVYEIDWASTPGSQWGNVVFKGNAHTFPFKILLIDKNLMVTSDGIYYLDDVTTVSYHLLKSHSLGDIGMNNVILGLSIPVVNAGVWGSSVRDNNVDVPAQIKCRMLEPYDLVVDSTGVIEENHLYGIAVTDMVAGNRYNVRYTFEDKHVETNATENDIVIGKSAYVNGVQINGVVEEIKSGLGWSATANDVTLSNNLLVFSNSIGEDKLCRSGANYSLCADNSTVASTIGLQANKIAKGKTILGIEGSYTSDADAIASDIGLGKTAYVNGSKITGTLPVAPDGVEESYGIDFAYYQDSGDGYTFSLRPLSKYIVDTTSILTADILYEDMARLVGSTENKIKVGETISGVTGTFTSDANATAGDILENKTAYVNGVKVTGTYVPSGSSALIGNSIYVDTFGMVYSGGITTNNNTKKKIIFNCPMRLTDNKKYITFIIPNTDEGTYARYLVIFNHLWDDMIINEETGDWTGCILIESSYIDACYRYNDVADFSSLTDWYGWNESPVLITDLDNETPLVAGMWLPSDSKYYYLGLCKDGYYGYISTNVGHHYETGTPGGVTIEWDFVPTNYVKSGTKYLNPDGTNSIGTLNLSNAKFPAVAGGYIETYTTPTFNRNTTYYTKLPTGLVLNDKRWAIIDYIDSEQEKYHWMMVSDYELPIYNNSYGGITIREDSNVTWYRSYSDHVLVTGSDYTVLDSITWEAGGDGPINTWSHDADFSAGELNFATNSSVRDASTDDVILPELVKASDLSSSGGYINIQGKFIQGTAS